MLMRPLRPIRPSKRKPAFVRVDVKGGDLTYGQRIELGGILANPDDRPEYELFVDVIKCLYGREPKVKEFSEALPLFFEAVEGISFWIKAESEQLRYEPSQDEKDAGIERYAKQVGEIGTAYAIAKELSMDPDDILLWKYGKVFGYLRKQKLDGDFQRRYNDLVMRRSRAKK